MRFKDEELIAIQEYSFKKRKKDVYMVFLMQIILELREIKRLLQQGDDAGNGSNDAAGSADHGEDKDH